MLTVVSFVVAQTLLIVETLVLNITNLSGAVGVTWFIWHRFQKENNIFLWQTAGMCSWGTWERPAVWPAARVPVTVLRLATAESAHLLSLFDFQSPSKFLGSGFRDVFTPTLCLVHRT